MTPVSERLRHDLDTRYFLLDRDRLAPWLMGRAANRDPGIVDCRGRAISVGLGWVFEGQLRSIFWSFIRPCIEDAIQEACDNLEIAVASYSVEQRASALTDAELLLHTFSSKIYNRMVALDLSMRKTSQLKYSELDEASSLPYDPVQEIGSAHSLIERKLRIIRQHFAAQASALDPPPKLIDAVDAKIRLPGISLDRKILWRWLKLKLPRGRYKRAPK